MKAFWPSSLPSARSANVSSDKRKRNISVNHSEHRDCRRREGWYGMESGGWRVSRGHTRDHDGDIALWLRLALVYFAVLLEVDSPTLLHAGNRFNLKFEDTIGLRAREQVSSEFDMGLERVRCTFLMRSCLSFSERVSRAVAMAVMRSEACALVGRLPSTWKERGQRHTLKPGTERSDIFVR